MHLNFAAEFAHIPGTIAEVASREVPVAALDIVNNASAVRIIAMGGSYNAACAAVEAFLARGVDARAELASHALHAEGAPADIDEAVILVSHSGTSVETIRAAERLRNMGSKSLICITNDTASELAQLCDVIIDQALTPATRVPFGPWITTYFTLYKLARARAGQPAPDWSSCVRAAQSVLDALPAIVKLAPTAPSYIEFFGRGAFRATAEQGTLIAREIARVPASAWESSTYRHGPIEAISDNQLSIIFAASEGRAAQLDSSFARALKDIVSNVIVVGPVDGDIPIDTNDEFLPLVSLLVPAVISYAWGEAAGIPIGQFRYTSHSITDEDNLVVEH
ncbi:SIS domain-containing protein [Arthrobacter sp. W4I7]|uniref:SIS domain-containing protein n=1 Tax=Arthrobacter sp. W4I7 TaxID=3042296 RepID=UPI00278388E1|nr:SIS domain-containing protein [Arthrobacter sp. W4I7]MDQ0693153.1 glucosamine--fructose-6-phosphate aminotransferase (isomerizing) [Arthrobacter sp. W4I7]